MVNHSNPNSNAFGNNSTTALPTCHSQSPLSFKKMALIDLRSDISNVSFMCNRQENSCVTTSGQLTNCIKVFGTNIQTSGNPFSPPQNKFSRSNDSGIIRLDLELGKRRYRDAIAEENVDCVNGKRYLQEQPITKPELERQRTCLPEENLLERQRTCLPELASVSTPSRIASPEDKVQQRMEHRFLLLQNVLKQCDESDQKDYIQMLRCLSPTELSRHAVELEKRSMQLSVEEVREIQRTSALDILGPSSNH